MVALAESPLIHIAMNLILRLLVLRNLQYFVDLSFCTFSILILTYGIACGYRYLRVGS